MEPGILLMKSYYAVQEDLRTDPYLKYILFLSLFLAGFWFWWRLPNFATADEYGRLLRPMKSAGYFLSDPGFDSLRRGATEGGASDATFYFHGLLLVPVFVIVVLTGNLGTFAGFAGIESRFTLWHTVPEWYWTLSLVVLRLTNVLLVVSIVYLTYRISVVVASRRAGQLSSVLTALSLAVIHTAHEANEDTPMLFLLLLVLYLSLRYANGRDNSYFLIGCALGGLAIAFKITGGVAVLFLGTAFVFRDIDSLRPLHHSVYSMWRPKVMITGFLIGFFIIYIGKPKFLFSGPGWFVENYVTRFARKAGTSTESHPIGYIALLRYLNGFGLPLTLGVIGGLIAGLRRCIREGLDRKGELIILIGIGAYLLVFIVFWHDFKTHHVLPSIPLLLVPLGITLARHFDDGNRAIRVVAVLLLVTTSVYAGAGAYQFANDPRDEATSWLKSEADPNATMTVYENSVADLGIIHGQNLDRYDFVEEPGVSQSIANDSAYTEWMVSTSERNPHYIQALGESSLHNPVQYPERAAFKQRLLEGDHSGYIVVAEFGQRPQERSRVERLLRAGIVPSLEKRQGYIVLLVRDETPS